MMSAAETGLHCVKKNPQKKKKGEALKRPTRCLLGDFSPPYREEKKEREIMLLNRLAGKGGKKKGKRGTSSLNAGHVLRGFDLRPTIGKEERRGETFQFVDVGAEGGKKKETIRLESR